MGFVPGGCNEWICRFLESRMTWHKLLPMTTTWDEGRMGEEKKRAVQFQLQSYTRESHCLMNPPVSSTHQGVNSVLGATRLGKEKKKSLPSGKLLWVARAVICTHRSPDGGGKLKSKNVLLKAECDQPQRRCWGERGLNCALRQLSPLSELDLLIS